MFLDFLQLSPLQILFSIVIIYIAYTVKGLSGFGSGLIAIPLLAFVFPITFIVPALGLLTYNGTIMQSFHLRKQVVWRDLLPLIPFTLFGISTALWLLVNLNEKILVRTLSIFVLLYSIYSLLPRPDPVGGRKWAVLAGSFGGMVSALFGTGGPFYVVYYKMRQLDKGQFRATMAMTFLIDGGIRIIGYSWSGLYSLQLISTVALFFPVLLLGMYTGHHLHIKMDQKRFNKLISILLLISAVMLFYKTTI